MKESISELKKAYKEGKTIQHMNLDGEWVDCDMKPDFVANHSFRVKPDPVKVDASRNETITAEELEKGREPLVKLKCGREFYSFIVSKYALNDVIEAIKDNGGKEISVIKEGVNLVVCYKPYWRK